MKPDNLRPDPPPRGQMSICHERPPFRTFNTAFEGWFKASVGLLLFGAAITSGELSWMSFILGIIGLNFLLKGFLAFMVLLEGALGGVARLFELLSGQSGAERKRPDSPCL